MSKLSGRTLQLLAEKYPNKGMVYEKIIYLESQLALPKGTGHFMSDLHGEFNSFFHIINNCLSVIREKVNYIFDKRLTLDEQAELFTLIYYPKEKIEQIIKYRRNNTSHWYRRNLSRLSGKSIFS